MLWLLLMAGAMSCPWAFERYWAKRWFRVLWWISLFMIAGSWLRAERIIS